MSRNGLKGKTYEERFGKVRAVTIRASISATRKLRYPKQNKLYPYTCVYCHCKFTRSHRHYTAGPTFCCREHLWAWQRETGVRPPSRKGVKLSQAHTRILSSAARLAWTAAPQQRLKAISERPSRPQRILHQFIKYSFAERVFLEYRVRRPKRHSDEQAYYYSLDVAIPKLRIAFEYDGEFWHRDTQRDQRRDKVLRTLGWTVIRINKYKLQEYVGTCYYQTWKV